NMANAPPNIKLAPLLCNKPKASLKKALEISFCSSVSMIIYMNLFQVQQHIGHFVELRSWKSYEVVHPFYPPVQERTFRPRRSEFLKDLLRNIGISIDESRQKYDDQLRFFGFIRIGGYHCGRHIGTNKFFFIQQKQAFIV